MELYSKCYRALEILHFLSDAIAKIALVNAAQHFRIEDESSNYRLWVGGYSGNATDSLSAHNGYPFSTVDRNHDEAPKCCPCAPAYGGGWWFYRLGRLEEM
jgi:Fibrinogen beta and gamma chains, C-terminal globular domain